LETRKLHRAGKGGEEEGFVGEEEGGRKGMKRKQEGGKKEVGNRGRRIR
jgi:hypothetical protein